MSKPESSNLYLDPSCETPRFRPNWPAAAAGLAVGLWLLAAMVSNDPRQKGFFFPGTTTDQAHVPANWMGLVGVDSVRLTFTWFGLAGWLLPVFGLWSFWLALWNARRLVLTRLVAMIAALVSASALAAFSISGKSDWYPQSMGGGVGDWLYNDFLVKTLGGFGSVTLLLMVYAVSLLFIFTRDIAQVMDNLLHGFHAWRLRRQAARTAPVPVFAPAPRPPSTIPAAMPAPARKPEWSIPAQGVFPAQPILKLPGNPPEKAEPKSDAKPAAKPLDPKSPEAKPVAEATPVVPLPATSATKVELNIVKPAEPKKARIAVPQGNDKDYKFPPFDLLKEQVRPATESDEEFTRNRADLVRILGEFDVEVSPGNIQVGPVITCYELVPAAGVRVEKISGLDKNIALGMRAQSVRILAPIPGKAAVGVEVPNRHPTEVGLREILESEDWVGTKAELPIALGKNVSGEPLISDLTKMPHLLIAGATGSGKSVCINAIIASIIYSKSPKDVRLIMVDPKVVELKIFNALPHMLIPVVTEPKKVPAALKWLLREMEQRYQMFAKENVRNILGFNARKKNPAAALPTPEGQSALSGIDPLEGVPIPERLPYIIAIIDELADLMMVAPAEIETCIARLAQLARAAGIHLIIATQRPSVNVITGVIKANLPSRIAFQVASQVDSRTIIDGKGADTLIGRGDMLFSPPGTSRLVRAQGAYVSDDEILRLVEFLKVNGPPQYATSVQQQIDRTAAEDADEDEDDFGSGEDMGDDEELYRQAIEVLKSTKRASTSMIQRRLRIGYNRAARIVDLMEERGLVGPENGSSPREILKDLDTL